MEVWGQFVQISVLTVWDPRTELESSELEVQNHLQSVDSLYFRAMFNKQFTGRNTLWISILLLLLTEWGTRRSQVVSRVKLGFTGSDNWQRPKPSQALYFNHVSLCYRLECRMLCCFTCVLVSPLPPLDWESLGSWAECTDGKTEASVKTHEVIQRLCDGKRRSLELEGRMRSQ